jgi:diacylglycerol kinase (ATP)
MHAILIHNPTAGEGRYPADALLAELRRVGIEADYCSSKAGDFGAALDRGADLVVVAGGDGTVAKVALALPNRATPLAILPVGTANNIARSMGIAHSLRSEGDLRKVIDGLPAAPPMPLNIGQMEGTFGSRRFVEGVGLGPIPQSAGDCEDVPSSERLACGRRRLVELLRSGHSRSVELRGDGLELTTEVWLLDVLNIRYAGPGLGLAPMADPGDGSLDLIYADADACPALADWIAAQPCASPPPVMRRRVKELTISWSGLDLHIDDAIHEASEAPQRIDLRLEPEPLRVLVPRRPDRPADQHGG